MKRIFKLGLCGLFGRMSMAVMEVLKEGSLPVELVGGTSRTVGANIPYPILSLDEMFGCSDVVIDFTTPEALQAHLDVAVKYKKPLVVGTTGLELQHMNAIEKASSQIALLYGRNMSLGINLMAALVSQASRIIGSNADADMDILELHHHHKKDAPSGTAYIIAEAMLEGKNGSFEKDEQIPWYDPIFEQGMRSPGKIGIAALRSGQRPGEHAAMFSWKNESLTISHQATDRRVFAQGALQAALWLAQRADEPRLYSMNEVLGFS
ncbi:MAG: 4-hydroxy-tetrahydrodipicolinate reductase [Alphaproteobacteria bacterium]|nr:4-hydroxy-tetrahydrodipicolinate reductase [Alphaproteobacteria bacterium]OJV45131.1 MAG: 4-hydroxy-tetrahydrodipicolinate reductase [Alphaproteobacteria bacterium 43-37]